MRLASFVHPHIGGTFTAFTRLRDGLTPHGIDLRWFGIGPDVMRAWNDAAWAGERERGIAVPGGASPRETVGQLVETVRREGLDGVLINVLADPLTTSAARHLPETCLRVMIVHNITPGTYAAARSIRDHVHASVGVSPRIRDDLVTDHGFDPARTSCVTNAVDISGAAVRPPRSGPARLIFVGRIEEGAKGVLWLPGIMRALPGDVTLTIAGDGPDAGRLRHACLDLGERVRFLGAVAPEEIGALLLTHDVMLMPSRYEGYGMVLAEAMAAGCVPVASRIRGVTDAVVTHGHDGCLFPMGDVAAAAREVMRVIATPETLAGMSANARRSARDTGGTAAMGAGYARVIRAASRTGLPRLPVPLDAWTLPSGLKPGLRGLVPDGLKNMLRVVRERAG